MLGATALFVYVVQYKLKHLISKPKNVNVDVQFKNKLTFPTVTFCNENKYRYVYIYKFRKKVFGNKPAYK